MYVKLFGTEHRLSAVLVAFYLGIAYVFLVLVTMAVRDKVQELAQEERLLAKEHHEMMGELMEHDLAARTQQQEGTKPCPPKTSKKP